MCRIMVSVCVWECSRHAEERKARREEERKAREEERKAREERDAAEVLRKARKADAKRAKAAKTSEGSSMVYRLAMAVIIAVAIVGGLAVIGKSDNNVGFKLDQLSIPYLDFNLSGFSFFSKKPPQRGQVRRADADTFHPHSMLLSHLQALCLHFCNRRRPK